MAERSAAEQRAAESLAAGTGVAFYGDDVTGSVDVLLQFARFGHRGRLFVGTPDAASLADAAAQCSVVGIAGIARSLAAADMDAEVEPALRALAALDPDIVQYKACSTADSSPSVGSLGRVIEIGRDVFGENPVPLLFAQPDFGRFTVFGHHFAREGGVVHRLDRQPTMSTHPTTPMDESDLAVHLARQTALPIGSLPFPSFTSADAIAAALRDSTDAAVVLDAIDDAQLEVIGRALLQLARATRPLFALGSGGLSRALVLAGGGATVPIPAVPIPAVPIPAVPIHATAESAGPVLVVSGSRSAQTRRQADAAARAGWLVRPFALDAADHGSVDHGAVIDALASGRSVVLTSDEASSALGDEGALATIARAAASVTLAAVRAGATSRVIVCGGDTSGRVVRLLGVGSLSLAANPENNVVLLRAHSDDPAIHGLQLLLKGGQVGTDNLFLRVAKGGREGT